MFELGYKAHRRASEVRYLVLSIRNLQLSFLMCRCLLSLLRFTWEVVEVPDANPTQVFPLLHITFPSHYITFPSHPLHTYSSNQGIPLSPGNSLTESLNRLALGEMVLQTLPSFSFSPGSLNSSSADLSENAIRSGHKVGSNFFVCKRWKFSLCLYLHFYSFQQASNMF